MSAATDRFSVRRLFVLSSMIADRGAMPHPLRMQNPPDDYEESARIVEAFAEGETDPRVLELLRKIATAIRDHAIDD
ncbi:hypothetical protein [Sphingomonas prati]|uniref:Uncharacterized protein n=1 Tax=Sphingomonas prati TaxID=1843237 RepID=A0A7W9BVH1_9SPHN|nr:hypothetical protein [Sphingomonas prati]MBB5730872.1 hypothetical protein [Sphingomonas prati]GGE97441.1 hypothetical protein GCM10011404_33230 [Sphingomonas prati]